MKEDQLQNNETHTERENMRMIDTGKAGNSQVEDIVKSRLSDPPDEDENINNQFDPDIQVEQQNGDRNINRQEEDLRYSAKYYKS